MRVHAKWFDGVVQKKYWLTARIGLMYSPRLDGSILRALFVQQRAGYVDLLVIHGLHIALIGKTKITGKLWESGKNFPNFSRNFFHRRVLTPCGEKM